MHPSGEHADLLMGVRMVEAVLPIVGAPRADERAHPGEDDRRSLRDDLRLERTSGGIVLVAAAVAAMALAATALARGARIDRDIAALTGQPLPPNGPDLVLAAAAGATMLLGTALAHRVVVDANVRRIAGFAFFAAGALIVAEATGMVAAVAAWPQLAAVTAVISMSMAPPAALLAGIGLSLGLVRLVSFALRARRITAARHPGPPESTSTPDRAADLTPGGSRADPRPTTDPAGLRARWRRGYDWGLGPDKAVDPATRSKAPIGVGLSGGGIRAASVMLGVLQDKTFREEALTRARYLVAVSGGGYTAGAFAQALAGADPTPPVDGTVLRDPQTVFAEGSAEEDHIRRNASYIARNPGEAVVALGLLAQHLMLNLIVLFGPAIVLGMLAGYFYRHVPITVLDAGVTGWQTMSPTPPTIGPAVWWAIAVPAVLAAGTWSLAELATTRERYGLQRRLSSTTHALGAVFWTVVIVGVVLPMVIWGSAWVLHQFQFLVSVPNSIATVLLTYVSSLAALLWRHRAKVRGAADSSTITAAVPRGIGQILLVVVTLTVLGLCWLLLFGGTATTPPDQHGVSTGLLWMGLLVLAISIIGGLMDETTLSLHPFYRQRLARAFAVRAVEQAGKVVPVPYDPMERTTLSSYARMDSQAGAAFPEVIFAASATVGDARTPPGSSRVSYTFSSRFVGGPEIGYCATDVLERIAPKRFQRDLTVQGAVALSGAALAASAGAQNSKWYETLFAVTGIRLGAWMPNPRFVNTQLARGRRWYEPGLPSARRTSYLLRELFGLHPADAPLVQVTDGGFYDNLGLIELFRRRCTTIYCIDASGDNPPPASTLAKVICLAYQELGVEVDLSDTPFATTPGTGKPVAPRDALTDLNPRLSGSGVMTARFTYPAESGLPEGNRTGTLVVAKAALWPELPYPLLAYALRNPTFPNDSTSDQWFDDGQYGAYTALGRELGAAAVAAMAASTLRAAPAPASTSAAPPGG